MGCGPRRAARCPLMSTLRKRLVVQSMRVGRMTPNCHCSLDDGAPPSLSRMRTYGHQAPRHDLILWGTVPARDVMKSIADLSAARMVRAGVVSTESNESIHASASADGVWGAAGS